jgi:hypothetical protein
VPFKSKAQERFMYAKHPAIAKEFSEHTPSKEQARLPEHVAREHAEKRKPKKK